MIKFLDFSMAIRSTGEQLKTCSRAVHTEKWQGFDIKNLPEAQMREIINLAFQVPLVSEDLAYYREQIKPNLPWADDHFNERVCEEPRNPGETWQQWPWANKADHSRVFGGKFSHTYMERYWPRKTGKGEIMRGHRFEYGDLNDVVDLLLHEPNSRQAYLPIFFPEDTGAKHGNRVPCTLGYFWIQREGALHVHYPIRSCDFYRHFRDDLYLTTRLTLWLLDKLREKDPWWNGVRPGNFSMWIGSLHVFINDYRALFGEPA